MHFIQGAQPVTKKTMFENKIKKLGGVSLGLILALVRHEARIISVV